MKLPSQRRSEHSRKRWRRLEDAPSTERRWSSVTLWSGVFIVTVLTVASFGVACSGSAIRTPPIC